MMHLIDLNQLSLKCFNQAYSLGWYTDAETGLDTLSSSLTRKVCPWVVARLALIGSEITEAYDGMILSNPDEHLPKYSNFTVELADTVIRIMDLAGCLNIRNINEQVTKCKDAELDNSNVTKMVDKWFVHAHNLVSYALEAYRKGYRGLFEKRLAELVSYINDLANVFGLALWNAVDDKLVFNANRPDHKLENRQKEGGKGI